MSEEIYIPHENLGSPIALLGFVADHRRVIKDGRKYDHLIPPSSGTYEIVNPNGTVRHTVQEMDKFTHETLSDTAKVAPLLIGKDLATTLKNDFDFVYNHCQYKLDKDGVEELRRPKRSWRDGQVLSRNPKTEAEAGIDCDCMSIFIASLLLNQGIDCKFRITDYGRGWQHVYVIVPLPTDKTKYWVIDPVLNNFNEEKIYSNKFDHNMSSPTLKGIPLARLGSIDTADHEELDKILNGYHFARAEADELHGLGATETGSSPMLSSILSQLKTTRDYIRNNPDSVMFQGGAKNHIEMLDYAISRWNTPERDAALDLLEKKEQEWNKLDDHSLIHGTTNEMEMGFNGDDDAVIEGLSGLGKFSLKKAGQNFFGNIKKAVQVIDKVNKKIATKIIGQKAVDKITKIQEKVTEKAKVIVEKVKVVAKKIGDVIKKFLILSNPLTLAMRAGFLAAMKVNLFKMAQRLYPGYFTEGEAAKMGVNKAQWEASQRGVEKVGDLFDSIGGSRNKMERFIRDGRAGKKLNGIGEIGDLGYDVTIVVLLVTAAVTIISAVVKMAQAGISSKNYRALEEKKAEEKTKQAQAKAGSKYQDKKVTTTTTYDDGSDMSGLGDETNPTMEENGTTDPVAAQAGADNEPPPVAEGDEKNKSGGAFKRFIAAIKAFFHRRKKQGVQEPDANAITAQEAKDSTEPGAAAKIAKNSQLADLANQAVTFAYSKAKEAKDKALSAGATADDAEAASKAAYLQAAQSQEAANNMPQGFGAKVMNFVKENPGKVALITIVAGSLVVLAVSPGARRAIGIGKKSVSEKPAALGGVSVYRKGHKVSKPKAMLPSGSHVKRVVLK